MLSSSKLTRFVKFFAIAIMICGHTGLHANTSLTAIPSTPIDEGRKLADALTPPSTPLTSLTDSEEAARSRFELFAQARGNILYQLDLKNDLTGEQKHHELANMAGPSWLEAFRATSPQAAKTAKWGLGTLAFYYVAYSMMQYGGSLAYYNPCRMFWELGVVLGVAGLYPGYRTILAFADTMRDLVHARRGYRTLYHLY